MCPSCLLSCHPLKLVSTLTAEQVTMQGVVGDGQTAERPGPLAGWQEGEQQTVQFQVERKTGS
jgi:hypothetical protein